MSLLRNPREAFQAREMKIGDGETKPWSWHLGVRPPRGRPLHLAPASHRHHPSLGASNSVRNKEALGTEAGRRLTPWERCPSGPLRGWKSFSRSPESRRCPEPSMSAHKRQPCTSGWQVPAPGDSDWHRAETPRALAQGRQLPLLRFLC